MRHSTSRVLYIALSFWDQMNVRMEDLLSCDFSTVLSYIKSFY